jgi:peptidoglycan biosynthesis protein MviN/MurJ (putative lipid II flippase)
MTTAVEDAAPVRTTAFVGSVNLIAQVADKLFSFGQIILIAAFLGASPSADLLFLASIVPLTIGYVVGEPIGRAFLTLLVREPNPQEARHLAASAFVLTGLALTAITLAYAVTACVLVTLLTPGGSGSLAPWLTMSLIAPCAGLAGLLSGILLWRHDYTWAAARIPIASGTGLALVFLAAETSGRLVWIAVALAASYAVSALVAYLRVGRELGIGWGFATTREALTDATRVKQLIVGPTIGGAIGGQVIVTIERLLAGGLVGTGAVAVVSYARGIATAPTVLGQAVGASGYPRVVRAEAEGDSAFLRESFIRGLRLAIFFGLACTAFLLLYGPAAVTAILEHGKFSNVSAGQTARVLLAFAAATFSGSLIAYLVPFIYGLNRFRAIIWVELAIFLVYLVLAPLGAGFKGLTGLAVAFAIAQSCGVLTAIEVCRRALGLSRARLAKVVLVPVAVPVCAVIAAEAAYRIAIDRAQLPVQLRGIIRVGGGGICFLLAMVVVLLVSPLPEAEQFRRLLRGRRAQSVQ